MPAILIINNSLQSALVRGNFFALTAALPPADQGADFCYTRRMMVVAEIGTAHEGSLEKAKRLIDAASNAGADAVKFQWVYADEILHPNTGFVKLPGGNIRLYDRFKRLEVSPDFFADALRYARQKKMQFVCSPFGLKSLAELLALKPDAVKIASPELNHVPLLLALADERKAQKARGEQVVPVIVSTGVSKLGDIEAALEILGTENVTLLHCVTSYPAPESEYNVRLVQTLSEVFGVPCGVSDHSLDPVLVPTCAAALGSVATEKHITLSKSAGGLDDAVALEEAQFAAMTCALRQCEAALARYGKEQGTAHILKELESEYGAEKLRSVLGDGVKRLALSESENYGKTNRSLHFMRSMKAGEKIASGDVAVLRTEKNLAPGIAPKFLDTVQGATLFRDVQSGAGLAWDDILKK